MEQSITSFSNENTRRVDFSRRSGRRRSAGASMALKRAFDLTVATLALILFSPLIIAILAIIILRDGTPAIFRQERIGRGGRPFTLYKFRTMVKNSESDGNARLCSEHDDRPTPIGAFLRAHHLDELPQLWNVIRGDMSLVGHRPERRVFIEKIMQENRDYALLYSLRPGVFSMATLYNGYTDTMEKMLRRLKMDLDYMRNRSLMLDIKIIWLTFFSIISGKKF